jgi:hypothetical protein
MAWVALNPGAAFAGMPSVSLTDLARLRLQTISFFLVAFLLCSWLIQLLWNYLRRDFTSLPRLTYGKALGLVTLWGLLFVLVLTMISGARELMTPGAWEKQGATYRLAGGPAPAAEEASEKERRGKLEQLRAALWVYARSHQGRFPADRSAPEIPAECWRLPGDSGLCFVYVGGRSAGQGALPLAYEPETDAPSRLVLLTNGEVRRMELEDILLALRGEGR